MKKNKFFPLIVVAIALVSCVFVFVVGVGVYSLVGYNSVSSTSEMSSSYDSSNYGFERGGSSSFESGGGSAPMAADSSNYDSAVSSTESKSAADENSGYYDEDYVDYYDEDYVDEVDEPAEEPEATGDIAANPQKLVYYSSFEIETLDFDKSSKDLDDKLKEVGGFIEYKYSHDDGSRSSNLSTYSDEVILHKTSMTVRVPFDKYDSFVEEMPDIGNVRSSTENVENLTASYGTLQSKLEVYETRYDNYMQMLADTSDEEVMLQIQESLTYISVEIADLKSQMASIDTDVSYSTIDIVLIEVTEYEEKVDTTTFFSRFRMSAREGVNGLLGLLEGLVMHIMRAWYLWLLFFFIIWLIYTFIRVLVNTFGGGHMPKVREMIKIYRERRKANKESK